MTEIVSYIMAAIWSFPPSHLCPPSSDTKKNSRIRTFPCDVLDDNHWLLLPHYWAICKEHHNESQKT